MSGKNDNRPMGTDADRLKYQQEWAKMMIQIWRERIEKLHLIDTYTLHNQITEAVTTSGSDDVRTITHTFVQYGIYQDMGVGRGFTKNNGGNLEWMGTDREYLQHRRPNPWFSRAYYASVMVLKEQMAYMYGEEFCGLLVEKIEQADKRGGKTLRSSLWG